MQTSYSLNYGIQQRPAVASGATVFPAQWVIKPYLEPTPPGVEASTWVKLLELPSNLCHDEALLLCPDIEGYWLAWVPDQGEILLHISQFEPA